MRSKPIKSLFQYSPLLFIGAILWGCNYDPTRGNDRSVQPPVQTSPSVAVPIPSGKPEIDCKNDKKPETPVFEGRKTIEGTIVGHGGGTYWSNIIIESGGRRYSLEIESQSPDGKYGDTLPGVQSGQEIPIGARVRIVSASRYDAGRLTTLGSDNGKSVEPTRLDAKRLIRLPSGRNGAAAEIDQDFKNFVSKLVSAAQSRDRAAIESLMDSSFEVSFPPYEIQPGALFHELDSDVILNGLDRDVVGKVSGKAKWDNLDQALATGTRPYQDAEAGRNIRITNSFDNTLFFELLCDGKWRWIRYLGYPGVVKLGR